MSEYRRTTVGELSDGDTLIDLDNGYVVDIDNAEETVAWIGYAMGSLPSNLLIVTFHDAQGNENYLIMDRDHPINVAL